MGPIAQQQAYLLQQSNAIVGAADLMVQQAKVADWQPNSISQQPQFFSSQQPNSISHQPQFLSAQQVSLQRQEPQQQPEVPGYRLVTMFPSVTEMYKCWYEEGGFHDKEAIGKTWRQHFTKAEEMRLSRFKHVIQGVGVTAAKVSEIEGIGFDAAVQSVLKTFNELYESVNKKLSSFVSALEKEGYIVIITKKK